MLVSIIIPYFKDEKNIFLSVSSALKQAYKNIEIIIIDNENSINSKRILNFSLRKFTLSWYSFDYAPCSREM